MKRLISFLLAFVMLLGMMPTVMAASPFVDVPADAYYYDAVLWAVEQGVTTGTGNGKFSPLMNCTRSQVVTFLWRAAGSPEPTATEMSFTDVPADAYYYDAVLWAVENNITTGTGNGKFSPLMDCSRAQIVTFLWRSQGSPAVSGVENPFKDVPVGQYYTDAVLWAVKEGITTGTAADKFSPDMICTRSQIVTFLFRGVGIGGPGSDLVIVTHPQDVTCAIGEEIRFLTEVEGGQAPYTYQWQVRWDGMEDYVDITVDDSAYYEGWTYEMLRFTAREADFRYSYWYRCVVTDALGNSVTSDEATVIEKQPLTIVTQPENVAAAVGDQVSFRVEVSEGAAPYTYQWQCIWDGLDDFEDLSAADDSWCSGRETDCLTFKASSSDFEENYRYRCVITDAAGNEVISDPAKIYSNLSAKLTADDTYLDDWDDFANLTVTVTGGTAPYEYRWSYKYSDHDDWITSDNWTDNPERVVYYGYGYSETYYCEVRDATGRIVTTNRVEIQSKKIV